MVIAIASLCTATGSLIRGLLEADPVSAIISALVFGILVPVLYGVLTVVSYFVAKNALRGEGSAVAVQRTVAYAMAPQVLRMLVFIPVVGAMLAAIGMLWSIIASIMAISEAMDFESGKAVVSGGAGWITAIIVLGVLLP